MFSWSMLVAGTLWLLTLPVVLADVVLIYIDHHYGRHPSLFGIGTNQWPQLAWAFGQPQIYAVAHPGAGRGHRRDGHPLGRPPAPPQGDHGRRSARSAS